MSREPAVIQREDGIEKRWPVSCNSCRLPIGYHLDWIQAQDESLAGTAKEGKKEDVLYVLPGGLVTTDEMKEGKKPSDSEMKLGMTSV